MNDAELADLLESWIEILDAYRIRKGAPGAVTASSSLSSSFAFSFKGKIPAVYAFAGRIFSGQFNSWYRSGATSRDELTK